MINGGETLEILLIILAAAQAYLLGSLNFAVIISKLFANKDVREFGSGNAGMTNVLRVFGVLPGLLTFLLDAAKGFAACYIGQYVIFAHLFPSESSAWLPPVYGAFFCGVFCMLGHVFPLFFQFKGGKAVAVSVGIFAVAEWRAILIVLGIFILVLLISRIISISSLTATAAMPLCIILLPGQQGELWIRLVLTMIMVAIIYLKHTENIKRLIKGEEKPIFGKSKEAKK